MKARDNIYNKLLKKIRNKKSIAGKAMLKYHIKK